MVEAGEPADVAEGQPPKMQIKKSVKSARLRGRAETLLAIMEFAPSLEAAIKSRNNSDFRTACVQILRAANDEDSALQLAKAITMENFSAFMKLCEEVFEGVEPGKASTPAAKLDISKLMKMGAPKDVEDDDGEDEETEDEDEGEEEPKA